VCFSFQGQLRTQFTAPQERHTIYNFDDKVLVEKLRVFQRTNESIHLSAAFGYSIGGWNGCGSGSGEFGA